MGADSEHNNLMISHPKKHSLKCTIKPHNAHTTEAATKRKHIQTKLESLLPLFDMTLTHLACLWSALQAGIPFSLLG